jgi:hypothetical protein
MKGMQSIMIIFRGWPTVRDADGIPLESYPADAAQNVVTMFAQSSLWRLIVCLLGVVVLVRYRSAVALMFVVFIASYLGAQVLSLWAPLIRVGSPPGTYVNLIGFIVMVVGLVFSLMSSREEGFTQRTQRD